MAGVRIYRQHDQIPDRVDSALLRKLLQEWVELNSRHSVRQLIDRWSRREELLCGLNRPGDIVDAVDTSVAAGKDELLLALIRLHHSGQQCAGRIALQAMLPKLSTMARTVRGSDGGNATLEDRYHVTVASFWETLSAYPVRRRTKVAANLALDTLYRLTRESRQPFTETAVAPEWFVEPGRNHGAYHLDELAAVGEIGPNSSLVQVLLWSVKHDIITPDEAQLILDVTDRPAGYSQLASQMGVSPAALRQRSSRVQRKLVDNVSDQVKVTTSAAA